MKIFFLKNILVKWLWIVSIAFLCIPLNAKAQNYSPSELDTLVSTIALYPDPLLAHMLTASIHNDEIPSASLWANAHKSLKGEALTSEMQRDELDYDASILALIPFPSILSTMAKYSTWTSQLGMAVLNQNGAVLEAIQRMRNTAYEKGNLKTDQHMNVNKGKVITIEPVQAQYIYVPVYNPSYVYYVYSDRYVPMHYSYGVWTGHWYNDWVWNDCWFEWHSHTIRHHPRPPRHYAPPRHGGSHYSPAPPPRPRNERVLPQRNSARQLPPPQNETRYFEQTEAFSQERHERDDRSFGNVTATRSNTSNKNSSDSYSNNDYRKRNDNGNNNGGFRKSFRR